MFFAVVHDCASMFFDFGANRFPFRTMKMKCVNLKIGQFELVSDPRCKRMSNTRSRCAHSHFLEKKQAVRNVSFPSHMAGHPKMDIRLSDDVRSSVGRNSCRLQFASMTSIPWISHDRPMIIELRAALVDSRASAWPACNNDKKQLFAQQSKTKKEAELSSVFGYFQPLTSSGIARRILLSIQSGTTSWRL